MYFDVYIYIQNIYFFYIFSEMIHGVKGPTANRTVFYFESEAFILTGILEVSEGADSFDNRLTALPSPVHAPVVGNLTDRLLPHLDGRFR